VQVTCRCGSQVEIPEDGGPEGRSCPYCGIPIRLALTLPVEGGDGILLRCFCTHELHLPASARGTTITCMACRRMILIPSTDGALLEIGAGDTGVSAHTLLCPECGKELPDGESGSCAACRAARAERRETRRRTRALVRPGVREARSPAARIVLVAIVLAALGLLGWTLRNELLGPSSGPREELAPATRSEVARRLQAWSPVLLDAVRDPALQELTRDLTEVEPGELLVTEEGQGYAVNVLHFTATDGGVPVSGYVQLTPRFLPQTLDPARHPPLLMVDVMLHRVLTDRDGAPLTPPKIGGKPSGVALTCAYDPRRGNLEVRSWSPPLATRTEPEARGGHLVASRTPAVREVFEIARRDGITVLRLLAPQLRAELEHARPGCEVLLVSHEPIPDGGRDLTLHLQGPHPRHGEEPILWRLHLAPEVLVEQLDRTPRDPIVPIQLVLEEELLAGDTTRVIPTGGTTTIRCRVDRDSGTLYLPPKVEHGLTEASIFPDWR
jgi:hypothetical protein